MTRVGGGRGSEKGYKLGAFKDGEMTGNHNHYLPSDSTREFLFDYCIILSGLNVY